MEYIVIGVLGILLLIILKFVFGISIKEIKQVGINDKLDTFVKEKFPENLIVGEKIRSMLGNKKVKIKETKEEKADTSLYFVMSDTIEIANISKSYTRIQTIAHECVHSIQDKRLLIFHFIFSNIYLFYFVLITILTIFHLAVCKLLFLVLLCIFSMIFYSVRSLLETDAMTRARYVAKEYMEQENTASKEEIEEIVTQYDKLNKVGIKAVNYQLLASVLFKISVYSFLAFFF